MDPNASLDDIIKRNRKAKAAQGAKGKKKPAATPKRNSPAKKAAAKATVRGRGELLSLGLLTQLGWLCSTF